MKKYDSLAICTALIPLGIIQAAEQKPNVVFIITDDLNDNLGCYGHPMVKTPNIDRLAREGLLFQSAIANYPLCGPSRNCIMSGLYPDQTGLTPLRAMLRDYCPDVVTLSQHFMKNGYTAARVGKVFHADNPSSIGTDGHDDILSWNERINPRGRDKDLEGRIQTVSGKPGFGAQLSWYADPDGKDEEHTDGMVATESVKLIKKYAAAGQPFFLAVGLFKPHTPFVAPKKYFDLYDLSKIIVPTVPDGYFKTLPEPAVQSLRAHKEQIGISEDKARLAIQAYYATISFLDAQVGRVLDSLDELGLRENTIVLFTSDNGYHLGEHDYWQKITLFEPSGRLPLIISAPGMKTRGQTTASFFEMIDLYPTLSDLAGLPVPSMVSGISQAALLQDAAVSLRDDTLMQIEGGYSLRTAQYRYSRWKQGGPELIELYDRAKDPNEMQNLAGNPEYQTMIKDLDARLTERIKRAATMPKGLVRLNPPPPWEKEKLKQWRENNTQISR